MSTLLKVGDSVQVIAGGNKTTRPNKGKVGKLLSFHGANDEKVLVEGVNFSTFHRKASNMNETGGKISKEAPIHISNVLYYAEKLKRPVKLSVKKLEDGTKVRGYRDPKTKEFTQI